MIFVVHANIPIWVDCRQSRARINFGIHWFSSVRWARMRRILVSYRIELENLNSILMKSPPSLPPPLCCQHQYHQVDVTEHPEFDCHFMNYSEMNLQFCWIDFPFTVNWISKFVNNFSIGKFIAMCLSRDFHHRMIMQIMKNAGRIDELKSFFG